MGDSGLLTGAWYSGEVDGFLLFFSYCTGFELFLDTGLGEVDGVLLSSIEGTLAGVIYFSISVTHFWDFFFFAPFPFLILLPPSLESEELLLLLLLLFFLFLFFKLSFLISLFLLVSALLAITSFSNTMSGELDLDLGESLT